MRRSALWMRVRVGERDDARTITVVGRNAWALRELINAGEQGCTPIDAPGPRWSGYVHNLRKLGIVIETVQETHGGTFAGCHARYVLRSPVIVLDVDDPQAQGPSARSQCSQRRSVKDALHSFKAHPLPAKNSPGRGLQTAPRHNQNHLG